MVTRTQNERREKSLTTQLRPAASTRYTCALAQRPSRSKVREDCAIVARSRGAWESEERCVCSKTETVASEASGATGNYPTGVFPHVALGGAYFATAGRTGRSCGCSPQHDWLVHEGNAP